MKALIFRTSENFDCNNIKEFQTLEELLSFADTIGEELIIGKPDLWIEDDETCADFIIEIYDDYRE